MQSTDSTKDGPISLGESRQFRYSLINRIRFQLGVGLLTSSFLPLLAFSPTAYANPTLVHAFIASNLAVIFGYYFLRGLTQYPTTFALSFVWPTFSVSYAVVLAVFLLFRLPYSSIYMATSFLACLLWFHAIYFIVLRRLAPRFAVVPFGNIDPVSQITRGTIRKLVVPSIQKRHFDALIVDLRADLPFEWQEFVTESAIRGMPIYHVRQIVETVTGRVEISHLSESAIGTLQPSFVYWKVKHWIDRLAAVVVLPLLVPLFVFVAILIRFDSRGPVFYRQERMVYRGRTFQIWKFRSMYAKPDAENDLAANKTEKGDPRITRIGRFLRKTRIDELPQVINILNGEMSWIGPRPEAVALSRAYEKQFPFYRYRHVVRPGITGWAQVNQGHVIEDDEILDKLHYDFFYIKYFSPWIDILIVLRTIKVMLTGHGAK